MAAVGSAWDAAVRRIYLDGGLDGVIVCEYPQERRRVGLLVAA